MHKQYKERNFQVKEMEEMQIKNKYLQVTNVKLKNILKIIAIGVDIPRDNYLDFFKWIAKKAIWAAILLLFSILTTIGCLDLLFQYINGVTTAKIDVSRDRNFSFPSSTVCLPMYQIDFCMCDENFDIENPSQFLHSEVSEYIENHHHDKEAFLNRSFWSFAMLSVLYNYSSHVHFVENYEWTMDTVSNFSEYMIKLQKKDWWEAGRTLEKELNKLNISITELTEAVGQDIAIRFNLGITHYTAYDGLIHPSNFSYKTSFVGSNWICYNVDFSDLVITSQEETIVVEFKARFLDLNWFIELNKWSRYYVLFAPSANFHMDLKMLVDDNFYDDNNWPLIVDPTQKRLKKNFYRESLGYNRLKDDFYRESLGYDRLKKNYYLGSFGYDRYISYDLIQMYRFMPIIDGRQQCSEVRSTELCRTHCRASLIKNLCSCTATSLTTPEAMYSDCTLTSYENCSIYDANNDSMCDCLKPCTRWDYEMKELSWNHDYNKDYSGRIIIRLAKLDYRIIEQTYLWKMEGFIGAFGGALSLWLGIDFLMAINFFSMVVERLTKTIIKSKQPSSSTAVINRGRTHLKKQDNAKKENQAALTNKTEKRIAGDELLTIKAIIPSNWSCYKVLSLIVNLIFSLATVIMCVRLFQQYFSDPPIIEMSVPCDETYELSKLTEIILPMYSINLELDINETLYGEKIDQYFGKNQMEKAAFLSSTNAWPPEIFALCFKYLAYLSAVEGTDLEYLEKMNFSEQAHISNYYFLKKKYSGEFYDEVFRLEKKLSQIGVTIKELKLSVAEKLKSAFQLSVKYVYAVDGVVTKENISIIENTCINEYRVCFKADFSNKPIRRPGDYIEVSSIINQSILPRDDQENRPELIVDFDGQIMRDIHNLDDNFANMKGRYGFLTTYQVFTVDVYRKIPSVKGKTQCTNYEKKDQCRWQCRSEMIHKKCNCTTMSLPLPSLPERPECSFSIYNICLQYTIQDDMQCIQQCLKPCEKWKYQVDIEKQIALEEENKAIIQIKVKKFDYAMFVEKLPWTFEAFAGAVGGVLGLWLGLDFVIMIGAVSEITGYILTRILQTLGLKKMNAGPTVPKQVQTNERSKKRQEESDAHYFTSAIMIWWKKSFEMLIKALYSMKLVDILKVIVVKIFWSYLVVFFGFLTFNMCFLSTKQYLKNPTTTKMQFLLNNTFIMPTSTLCVPVSIDSLHYMADSANITEYKSTMMKYFTRNQENKEAFLNVIDKKWPLEVYAIIYVYLSTFGRKEGFVFDSYNLDPIDLTSYPLRQAVFPSWEYGWKKTIISIIFELETILKQMNVSRSELLQSFGQQTLMIYNISILHINKEELIESRIEIGETLSVDCDLGVCFKIDFSGAAIRSEVEQFYISIDSNGIHQVLYQDLVYFDIHGRYKPDDNLHGRISLSFEHRYTYLIGAREFDQIFPGKIEDPGCDENVSPELCRLECRASLIKRLCNCTAASLPTREVSSLSDECTLAAYQICLNYDAGDDFECRRNCLRSCKRETYQWKLDSKVLLDDSQPDYPSANYDKVNLILRVEDFGYRVFEEEYEWTFEKFLGKFGGNLGLWMGLDVKMVLIEIFSIVFVIGVHVKAFISAKIAGNAVIVQGVSKIRTLWYYLKKGREARQALYHEGYP